MVDEMMVGKTKPNYLVRVGNTLYKRISDEARQINSGGVSDLPVGASQAKQEVALAPDLPPHIALELLSDPLGAIGSKASPSEAHVCAIQTASSSVTDGNLGVPSPRQSGTAGSSSPQPRGSSGLVVPGGAPVSAEGFNSSHLLRPRSAARVLLAEDSPRSSGMVGPSSATVPSGGGGLLSLVKDLGLAGDTTSVATSWETEAEEAAAAKARIAAAAAAGGEAEGSGEDLCIICYDQPPSCVFLECGHGGFCKRCAYLLFVRPPCECPTCRQAIEQVVELTEITVPIGQVSSVKK